MTGLHFHLVSQEWIVSSCEENLHTQGNLEFSPLPCTLGHPHTSWIFLLTVCPLFYIFQCNRKRSKQFPAWSDFLCQWYLGILHETSFCMICTRLLSLQIVTRWLQSMHITLVSGVLISLPFFGSCKNFSNDFIHKFAKVTDSGAPIDNPSVWVYQILLHLKWTFVTASLERLFIADLGISDTSSLEYSFLSAISVASSTGTLVYKLFTSRDTTSSSSSNLIATRAVLASFELVSILT